jgi:hypothetical protein
LGTEIGGALPLDDLCNRCFANLAGQAFAVINFGLHHEVTGITFTVYKIFQATTPGSYRFF